MIAGLSKWRSLALPGFSRVKQVQVSHLMEENLPRGIGMIIRNVTPKVGTKITADIGLEVVDQLLSL